MNYYMLFLGVVTEEVFRPVLKRDRHLLIHWYYHPDSYDSWLEDWECEADSQAWSECEGAWEVSVGGELIDQEIHKYRKFPK